MGNLLCLTASRKDPADGSCIARQVTPIPSLRHLKPKPASKATLQDICVAVIAENITSLDVSILPAELNQRVVDLLCDLGELHPDLLHRLCVPWLYGLRLADYQGCCDTWLAAAAGCSYLMTLDLSNCNMVTDAGLVHVRPLEQLRVLLLANCCQVTDDGLKHIRGLTRLRELSLEGCDCITSDGCAALEPLVSLQRLNLAQCRGLDGNVLRHLTGLCRLEELSLGWCRQLSTTPPPSTSTSSAATPRMLLGLPLLPAGLDEAPGAPAAQQQQHLPPLLAATVLTSLNTSAVSSSTAGNSSGTGSTLSCKDGALLLRQPVLGPLQHLAALKRLAVPYTRITGRQLEMVAACLPAGLQALDLSGNVGVSPRGLTALSAKAGTLRELRLRGVKVGNGAGPAAIAALTGLRHLDLACSEVGDLGLAALQPLTALTHLDLDMCDLTDDGCKVLKAFKALRHLDLSETRLGDTGASVLRQLTGLRCLVLSNTNLGVVGVGCLTGLRELQVLHLDTRGMEDAVLQLLRPLGATLVELDLNGGRITSRGTTAFAGYSQLTRLDLGGAMLSDPAARELSALPALQHLSLAQNSRLGDAGLRCLARGLGGVLEALNLSYTGVSDIGLTHLAGMKALRVVSLSGTRVTPAGVTWLRRHAPSLLVKYNPCC